MKAFKSRRAFAAVAFFCGISGGTAISWAADSNQGPGVSPTGPTHEATAGIQNENKISERPAPAPEKRVQAAGQAAETKAPKTEETCPQDQASGARCERCSACSPGEAK